MTGVNKQSPLVYIAVGHRCPEDDPNPKTDGPETQTCDPQTRKLEILKPQTLILNPNSSF